MTRGIFPPVFLLLALSVPLGASTDTVSGDGACQATTSGCASTVQMSTATPVWQTQLTEVQKAGDACKPEIDKFCEGVQVGEGRLEKCLKAHTSKLSKKCKAAQGWK